MYRLCLKTGIFRLVEGIQGIRCNRKSHPVQSFCLILNLPEPGDVIEIVGDKGVSAIKDEADEIVNGTVFLFKQKPTSLNLTPPGELRHWTHYGNGSIQWENPELKGDIKFIWEPARFGWAFILCRAYHLIGDEAYAETFWNNFELFEKENPANMGPNWSSAQEVALRIFAFTFALHVFRSSFHTTEERKNQLALSVAAHAKRIQLTLIYARAQNNNHLLSEALGLITASYLLAEHPRSRQWRRLGEKWFVNGLINQIDEDGAYIQQSTNYQRFLLQLILWASILNQSDPDHEHKWKGGAARRKINNALHWLLALCDPLSGEVPNLGANDGSYIFPLTILPGNDYRPVLQAASAVLLGKVAFQPGAWDEMVIWFDPQKGKQKKDRLNLHKEIFNTHLSKHPIVLKANESWGYLRVAHFNDRPGHADQLHLDLWWKGVNVALDPGTYLYNGQSPWENALTHSGVHNTVIIDGREQMTRVGRFLYVDRAQAKVISEDRASDGSWVSVDAIHDGYRQHGMIHNRKVTAYNQGTWTIEDEIRYTEGVRINLPHEVRLHWLLPDWEWKIIAVDDHSMILNILSPFGWIDLNIHYEKEEYISTVSKKHFENTPKYPLLSHQISRCGELLYGYGDVSPIMGWVSPFYGQKVPALSVAFIVKETLPISLLSEWKFPSAAL